MTAPEAIQRLQLKRPPASAKTVTDAYRIQTQALHAMLSMTRGKTKKDKMIQELRELTEARDALLRLVPPRAAKPPLVSASRRPPTRSRINWGAHGQSAASVALSICTAIAGVPSFLGGAWARARRTYATGLRHTNTVWGFFKAYARHVERLTSRKWVRVALVTILVPLLVMLAIQTIRLAPDRDAGTPPSAGMPHAPAPSKFRRRPVAAFEQDDPRMGRIEQSSEDPAEPEADAEAPPAPQKAFEVVVENAELIATTLDSVPLRGTGADDSPVAPVVVLRIPETLPAPDRIIEYQPVESLSPASALEGVEEEAPTSLLEWVEPLLPLLEVVPVVSIPAVAVAMSRVQFLSWPASKVYLDDAWVTEAPDFNLYEVPPGTYALRFVSGSNVERVFRVSLEAEQALSVVFNFESNELLWRKISP